MARILPRVVLPSAVAEFILLRDGVKCPNLFSTTGVIGADIARRVFPVDYAVVHATAQDHQVLVHYGWRRVGVVLAVDLPGEPLRQINNAVIAKLCHGLTAFRIEADQTIVASHEETKLSPIAPGGRAPMYLADSIESLPAF